MKLTKLMLSAFAAAVALVACNKVETDIPENASPKTVKLSFENIIMTKGLAGDKIIAGDPVVVNNFKIILTDASISQEYGAKKDASGTEEAVFYFSGETLSTAPYEFHYVDHKVTKVIAVANMGDITLEQLKAYTESIGNQQDQTKLILSGEATLTATGETHGDVASGKYTEVYSATVALKPVISRFEVDGFVINFSTPTPKFNKIEVTDIAFDHYYPNVKFTTAGGIFKAVADGDHIKNPSNYDNQAEVFGWLSNTATTGWYVDRFESGDVVMVPDKAETTTVFENKADTPDPLAYHFFAGDQVPTMVIRVLADGNPAYVYTSDFRSSSNNKILSTIEPGMIYRMSAKGVVDQTGGSVPMPDDFDPLKRCLDITVKVEPWVVDLITPEF